MLEVLAATIAGGFLALLPVLFGGGIGAGVLVLLIWRNQARTAAWRSSVARVGLTGIVENKVLGFVTRIDGRAEPFGVRIESYSKGKREQGTRVTVAGNGHIPQGLDLRGEGFFSQVDRTFGGKEIEVGDPRFDAEVYARGPEDLLLALCDAETRSLTRALIAMKGRVLDGGVRIEIKEGVPRAEPVTRALETALALARRLARPPDLVERLAQHVRSDPEPGVRERCLAHLTIAQAEHPAARAVFREALGMQSPELRLRAACALGAEGRETLLDLAMPAREMEGHAVRAIAALGKDLPLERAVSILKTARGLGLREATLAAVAALGLIAEEDALPHLMPLALDADHHLALAAVGALAARADARAEPALIKLLSSGDGALRLAAAQALGALGTAAAVAPLHEAVDAHLLDLDLRGAARQAIARIQSRVPGASPGQLSISAGEAGQMSLTGERQGRVTLAGKDE